MRRKKTILTIHDCVMLWRTQGIKHWFLWFFWIWLPSKRCQVIVAISESTRKQLLRELKCHPDKIQVIYNPVLPEFKATAKLFDASMPRILHIGTTENKNLIRHCAALEGINCEFIVIGKLKESQRQALYRAGLNYTNLVNLSDQEMVDQYRQADIVLFASTYEGFGLPIIEAQAIGRPVITSNLWSMPEAAGDGACFVDPFNLESIRSGVLKVIGNPDYRNRLIVRGYANVKRFDVRVIAEQYASLYRCVASASSGS